MPYTFLYTEFPKARTDKNTQGRNISPTVKPAPFSKCFDKRCNT